MSAATGEPYTLGVSPVTSPCCIDGCDQPAAQFVVNHIRVYPVCWACWEAGMSWRRAGEPDDDSAWMPRSRPSQPR